MHDGHSDAGDEVPNEEARPVGPHPAEDWDVSEQELQPLLLAAQRLQGALQRLRWDHQLPQPVPNGDFGRLEPLFKLGLIQSVSLLLPSFFSSPVIFLSVLLVGSFVIFRYTGSTSRCSIFSVYSDWFITTVALPLSAGKITMSKLSRRLFIAARSDFVMLLKNYLIQSVSTYINGVFPV